MKTRIASSIILLSVSLPTLAEDFSWGAVVFQPRAYLGYADYSLETGDVTYTRPNRPPETRPLQFDFENHSKIDFTGPLMGLGATVAVNRYYGDFYYQSTLEETVYSSGEQLSSTQTSIASFGDVDAQHWDWALSLGYRITDQWSVFAGYKAGKTDWDQSFRINRTPPSSTLIQDGNFAVEFEQDGPFLGTSYSFLIGPGALTIKAAYARLEGSYSSSFDAIAYGSGGQTMPLNQSLTSWGGNSDALSFGVSWTQSFSDQLGMSVGVNYHHYKFDTSGTNVFATTAGDRIVDQGVVEGGNLTEDMLTLTASVLYTF